MLEIVNDGKENGWYNINIKDFSKREKIYDEIKQEADNYVLKLSDYNERWKRIVEIDLKELCESMIETSEIHNKDAEFINVIKRDNHIVCTFIGDIYNSLIHNGYEPKTELSTQTLLAFYYFHWPKDDEELKQMSNFITYEQPAETSTPSADFMEDSTDLTPATANNEKQEKGKAGKKKYKKFREYFLPGIDADILLPILHDYIDGNVGKELAKYIVAITNVWIAEPGHKSVCKEFKASESAYKEAIDKHYCRNQYSGVRKDKIGKPFPEYELAAIRNNIKKRIEEINGDASTP